MQESKPDDEAKWEVKTNYFINNKVVEFKGTSFEFIQAINDLSEKGCLNPNSGCWGSGLKDAFGFRQIVGRRCQGPKHLRSGQQDAFSIRPLPVTLNNFQEADEFFKQEVNSLHKYINSLREAKGRCGSTYLSVVYNPKIRKLFTGNMGDSCAYLVVMTPQSEIKIVRLNQLDKPDHPEEKQRIEAMEGQIKYEIPLADLLDNFLKQLSDAKEDSAVPEWINLWKQLKGQYKFEEFDDWLVCKEIETILAKADLSLKKLKHQVQEKLNEKFPDFPKRIDGLSVSAGFADLFCRFIRRTPRVTRASVPDLSQGRSWLVVACDGFLEPGEKKQEENLGKIFAENFEKTPGEIADLIVNHAFKAGSHDNLTVEVADLNKLDKQDRTIAFSVLDSHGKKGEVIAYSVVEWQEKSLWQKALFHIQTQYEFLISNPECEEYRELSTLITFEEIKQVFESLIEKDGQRLKKLSLSNSLEKEAESFGVRLNMVNPAGDVQLTFKPKKTPGTVWIFSSSQAYQKKNQPGAEEMIKLNIYAGKQPPKSDDKPSSSLKNG